MKCIPITRFATATFLFLLLTFSAYAAQEAENAKKQAQQCADAQIAKDYATVVSFTHPALIKASGGKKALLRAIESSMKQVADEGIVFEKTVVHSASDPKKVGKSLVSLVTQEVTLRIPDGRMAQESTLVGYSYDDGKSWVFADTGEMDAATFHRFFPELKGVIDLPTKKEPVTLPDAITATSAVTKSILAPSDTQAAKDFFDRYMKLEREFDPSVTDLYSDDAVIKNIRRFPDGTSKPMQLHAVAYKKLLKQSLPKAKELGDTSKYSEVSCKEENGKVRITATRYSEIKKYSSPFSLLLTEQDHKWLIVEELSESQP